MSKDGIVEQALWVIIQGFYSWYDKKYLHLVEYDDLIQKPNETMASAPGYNYQHDFNHIENAHLAG